MRILYIILKITVSYALFFFYPRRRFVNEPKRRFGRTIYVSNHSASFMDPISIGALTRPIVFFMTRSDVFTPLTKPILWACHMLPIYRQRDGVDTKEKNKESFRKSSQVLKNGRNLLIFGEGETYDVFVRRHKPLKKGAVRMGFIALETINWSKDIFISAVGITYSDPNKMRSDYLISYSDTIRLNDFRKEYEENPNKIITDLTKRIEDLLKEQVIHVSEEENDTFHEGIQMITRKGVHPTSFDNSIDLIDRWKYAQDLAKFINSRSFDDIERDHLKSEINEYIDLLDRSGFSDADVYHSAEKRTHRLKSSAFWKMILFLPTLPLGLLHCYLPFKMAKNFAEKKFKRKVFWGSVKVVAGMILMGIINIPFIFLFDAFVYPNIWLALLYYIAIPFFGLGAYSWFDALHEYQNANRLLKTDLSELIAKRKILLDKIESYVKI